ncbi:MAG: hypothetical protein KatS3mg008_2191 [Acidimicrobiales bacterium]|nr:MAG: hypothetical protein KatS3mg008_2191 [Acidimicrobiales bacterium]
MDADVAVRWGDGPVVATAIHNGHTVRASLAEYLAVSESDRLREEDPYTGDLASVAPTHVVVNRSRFEVDLNRPRERCVYRTPEEAWGLTVWRALLPEQVIAESLAFYDGFYELLASVLDEKVRLHGGFVVLDVHSYNHRRDGPDAPPADPAANPEVNVGTGSMDRRRWAPVVDAFMQGLASYTSWGRPLDVRENVRFKGGHLASWVHDRYARTGCCLALEFKKVFMDEWTGECDAEALEALKRALASTLDELAEALASVL